MIYSRETGKNAVLYLRRLQKVYRKWRKLSTGFFRGSPELLLPRKPGDPRGPEKGPRYDRSAALQKMTAAAVLTAVARMPAPTMEAGAALPYWLR